MTATGVPFRPGFPAWLVVNEPGSAGRGGAATAVTEDRSYADGVLVELPVAEDSELLPGLLMPSGVLRTGPLAGCDLITSLTTGGCSGDHFPGKVMCAPGWMAESQE